MRKNFRAGNFDPLAMSYRVDERRHQTPSRSPMIKSGQSISAQDRAGQAQDYGTAQGTYGQFEGPVNQSPFYKALLTSGTDAAATQGANAKSAARARGKAAGFGYAQPAENVAEAGIDASTAATEAALPARTAAVAAPLSLEAAKGTESMGTALGQEGESYFKDVVPLEEQYQTQLQQQQQALWNAIGAVPQDLATMGIKF